MLSYLLIVQITPKITTLHYTKLICFIVRKKCIIAAPSAVNQMFGFVFDLWLQNLMQHCSSNKVVMWSPGLGCAVNKELHVSLVVLL